MANCCADCLSPTGDITRPTHRPAFLMLTSMGVKTVVIHMTLNLETGNIRVALISIFAGADRLVFNDSAECMIPTGTRIIAYFIDAGISFSTFVISAAAREDGRQGATAVVISADIAIRTSTDHGSHREGVNYGALGRVCAGVDCDAEWHTLLTEAAMLGGAVFILDTFWGGKRNAGNAWIACEANGTSALCLVF